jgi:hypothetical protein
MRNVIAAVLNGWGKLVDNLTLNFSIRIDPESGDLKDVFADCVKGILNPPEVYYRLTGHNKEIKEGCVIFFVPRKVYTSEE